MTARNNPSIEPPFPKWRFIFLAGFGIGFPIALAYPPIRAAVQAFNNRWLGSDQFIQAILDLAPYFRTYLVIVVLGTALLVGATLIFFAAVLAHAAVTRRAPSVFISYHHDMVAAAEALRESLERGGCVAVFIPFSSVAQHDALLDRIYSGIRACDFLICLPGAQPSFVEAEVAVAIGLRTPIVIVLPTDHAGAPNTSHKSYPAFVLEKLNERGFQPLVSFVRYLHGDWRATLELIGMGTDPPDWVGVPLVGIVMFGGLLLVIGGGSTMALTVINLGDFDVLGLQPLIDRLFTAVWFGFFYLLATLASLVMPLFLLGSVHAVGIRLRAILIVRRRVKEGIYSYELLLPLLKRTETLSPIMESFWTAPPLAHHEVPALRN